MRKSIIHALALPFTFVIGFSVQMIWDGSMTPAPEIQAVSDATDEEWHRLYEAAGMTGDYQLFQEVSRRLLCTNGAGLADAVPVEADGRRWGKEKDSVWCQRSDQSTHEVDVRAEYGRYHARILLTHAKWSLRNLEFIRTVVSPSAARAYVHSHEWSLITYN
jgi:hypothetical protein